MNLEFMALKWLRFERGCIIALSERSPREGYCGRPDALGVTPARYLYEVEVKRSLSDFHADFQKRSRRFRDERLDLAPKEFHYLAMPDVAHKILASDKLPDYAGVMTVSGWSLITLKPPKINRESNKLSVKECVRLCHQMANHLLASEQRFETLRSNFKAGYDFVPWGMEVDFQI